MTTVAAALAAARVTVAASEARLLLSNVVSQSIVWLTTHDDAPLTADHLSQFNVLVERRANGEPIAYLLGYREFYGRSFRATPAVLIPRPETELLVESVLSRVGAGDTVDILDLGTGSGCIAITLALERPFTHITAVDASSEALAIAQGNANALNAKIRLIESDWFDTLGNEKFDVIVSNPPYIAQNDPHLEQGDLRFEPSSALSSGNDGLDALREIIDAAPRFLRSGGWLWLEHGYDQAECVKKLLSSASFPEIVQHQDLAGILRVSGGQLRVGNL